MPLTDLKNEALVEAAREILRKRFVEMRRDDQDGYGLYRGNGVWDLQTMGLPAVTPDELNVLFDFVGVEPDPIIPLGVCRLCNHAHETYDGRFVEKGYEEPCRSCKRPRMSNFSARFDPVGVLRGNLETDPAEREAIDLVKEGWCQTSRAHHMLARIPPGLTAKEALAKYGDQAHAHQSYYASTSEDNAAGIFLSTYASRENGCRKTVSAAVFGYYRQHGGGPYGKLKGQHKY